MLNFLDFEKYQGLGNDFVLLDKSHPSRFIQPDANTIRKICNRHYGIGADGILIFNVIEENQCVEMVYYNADGSRAETCFNGLRCIALHAVRTDRISRDQNFTIKSDAGDINAIVHNLDDLVQIELSGPDFSPDAIGLSSSDELIETELSFDSISLIGTALSLGNPHFIVWKEGLNLIELNREILIAGSEVEHSSHFTNDVNFELVSQVDDRSINMAVWERGVGQTLACGSGATAAVCAGVKTGKLEPDREIEVKMIGGTLFIRINTQLDRVFFKGNAKHVFSGQIDPAMISDVPE